VARRLDDAEAILFAVGAGVITTWAPDNLEERIAFSSEVIAAGHELGWVEGEPARPRCSASGATWAGSPGSTRC
jgi:hypothetical protein